VISVVIHQQRQFRLAQHVDEAWRDDLTVGINDARRASPAQIADGCDTTTPDGNIRDVPR